jgi:hypothetical protein
MKTSLEFSTRVAASPAEAWSWMTSFAGIAKEMAPYMQMSAPKGVKNLGDVALVPGQRLFRSWITLFGVLPFDYSDLTLLSLEEGSGFVEQSPMGSMRLWRHERRITPADSSNHSDSKGCTITDTLTFEPRFASGISRRIVCAFFEHRHRQLKLHLG